MRYATNEHEEVGASITAFESIPLKLTFMLDIGKAGPSRLEYISRVESGSTVICRFFKRSSRNIQNADDMSGDVICND